MEDERDIADEPRSPDLLVAAGVLVAGAALVTWAVLGRYWLPAGLVAALVALHLDTVRRAAGMRADLARIRSDSASRTRHLRWEASHDLLTGLLNRAGLHDAIARRQAAGEEVSAMFVDLDHFKRVNDDLGHLAGDDVLRVVTRRLGAVFRPGDLVTRSGGDEFLVLLGPPCGRAELEGLAERVIQAVERPIAIGDRMVRISASIGMTTVAGDDVDVDRLVAECDSALYAAKRAGRGRAVTAEAGRDRS